MAKSSKSKEVKVDRRRSSDRRGTDRRQKNDPVAVEQRKSARRKVARRRQIDPTTCERDYTDEEIEFMQAMDAYKRANGRMFPTCSEILEVVRSLGYERRYTCGTPLGERPDAESATATGGVMLDAQDGLEAELAAVSSE